MALLDQFLNFHWSQHTSAIIGAVSAITLGGVLQPLIVMVLGYCITNLIRLAAVWIKTKWTHKN